MYGPATDQILAEEFVVDPSTAGYVFWTLVDNQGTVRDVIYNTGDLWQHNEYDGFGNPIWTDGSPDLTRSGYTGRDFDSTTGMQYNRNRWYDPGTGRWLSEDPLGFNAGDSNLYRYAGNSPTNATDPSGTEFTLSPEAVSAVKFVVALFSGGEGGNDWSDPNVPSGPISSVPSDPVASSPPITGTGLSLPPGYPEPPLLPTGLPPLPPEWQTPPFVPYAPPPWNPDPTGTIGSIGVPRPGSDGIPPYDPMPGWKAGTGLWPTRHAPRPIQLPPVTVGGR